VHLCIIKVKVKWSRYRPGVAQRVSRGIALLFHDRGTRRGWVVSSMPWRHITTGKDPVPILQEAGWTPAPGWTGQKISSPQGFDPGPSSPQSVTIPTELPGPPSLCNILRKIVHQVGFVYKTTIDYVYNNEGFHISTEHYKVDEEKWV